MEVEGLSNTDSWERGCHLECDSFKSAVEAAWDLLGDFGTGSYSCCADDLCNIATGLHVSGVLLVTLVAVIKFVL